MMTTAEQIKSWRETLEMTQERLARALSVSTSTVRNWESGRCEPRVTQYHAIEEMARKAREGK